MKNSNLIKRLWTDSREKQSPQRFPRYAAILIMLLTLGVGQMWGTDNNNINNITSVYIRGGMNSWTENAADWQLSKKNGDSNDWVGTFYINSTQEFKMWINGKYYACDAKDFNSSSTYQDYLWSEGDGNMKITRFNTTGANGYVKLDVELWGNYGNGSYNTSRLNINQSLVSALSPSLSCSPSGTSLNGGDTRTLSASCTGGSGGYNYSYVVTCGGADVTASTLSASSGASVTFTAPVAATEKTYTVTVTASDSHVLLSGLDTKTATKTFTVAATVTPTIAWAASDPVTPTTMVSGNDVTLSVVRANTSNTITWEYTTDDGDNWESLTPKSISNYGQTAVWTIPEAHGATQTYKFRALIEADDLETAKSAGVIVYGKKTIHVRNTNSWSNFYVYRYNSESDYETAWHGTTTGISAGDGQWKDVVMTSKYAYFIFNDNGSNQIKGSETYTYASSISDGGYYEIQESTGTNLTFTSSSEPAKPTVTTDDATASTSTSATFGAHLTAVNRDKVTTYGVIYKQSDSNIASAEALAAASPSSQSLGSNINSGTANNTTTKTITAGKDWYYAAFATNGKGTSYGDLKKLRTTAVTLDMQSGSGGSSSVVAIGGKAMPSATMPTRTGYTFGGYYTSTGGDGTQYYAANGSSATNWKTNGSASETLYAKWTANKYDVMLKLNGGTGTDNQVVEATYAAAMPTVLKTSGSAISIPTRTGYTLLGYWDATSGGNQYYSYNGTSLSSSRTWNKTSATNLYARWQANQYTLTLYKNDGGDTYTEETATYDATITVSAPTRTGYTFNGWYTKATDGTKVTNIF